MTDYRVRLVRSFIAALDKLAITLHEQSDAVRENTKATEEATNQQAKQTRIASPVSIELNKPVTEAVEGETKTQVKNSWDWRDKIRLTAELVGLGVLIWYACTTRSLWIESHKQVQVMQKQLESTDRPWIKVDIQPESDVTYWTTGQAQVSFLLTMTNVGHSVAVDAVIRHKVVVPKAEGGAIFTEPLAEQRRLCGTPPVSAVHNLDGEINTTVFPNDRSSIGIGDGISESTMKDGAINTFGKVPGTLFTPLLVGCVDYTFSTANGRHQTGFIYDIFRQERTNGPPMAMIMGTRLPRERIGLTKYRFHGDYAY